jgi:hypothetical protein
MKNNKLWVWTSGLLILTMMLSACSLSSLVAKQTGTTTQPAAATTVNGVTETPAVTTPAINTSGVYEAAFSAFPTQNVTLPAKFTGGYTLPLTADQVTGWDLASNLTPAQKQALLTNGFVVIPPTSDPNKMYSEFYQVYESNRYSSTPVFITTDSVFHIYHLVFDKMLRDLEKTSFIPTLNELTTGMVNSSLDQYNQLKGTNLEQAALRNLAYFTVAADLAGLQVTVPAEAQSLADQEMALINSKNPRAESPIWAVSGETEDDKYYEDYSQYTPRGHYTTSVALQNYFKSMMWYGRLTFRLSSKLETQRALLMVQAMRSAKTTSGKSATELWQNIYDPTVFIVGKSDDLSFHEYGNISDQLFGATPDLSVFGDAAKMAQFTAAAKSLPAPQINSMWVYIWQDRDAVTQGFRFMGQRFTLDEYVFGQLIYRKVGTLDNPRGLPKALDLPAAMGSDEAYNLLKNMGETKYENYDTQLTKVKTQVAGFGIDSWTQNLYWSWLYSLQPIFETKGEQYPAFMQTKAWQDKDLSTGLSSWTELKHDTILYSKQVMAEMGGGGDQEPPHGYVEPNPEALARLLSLAEMTRTGLSDRGILDGTTKGNLDNLTDELQFLLDMSQKELNGGKISDDDYWRLTYYGGWLESMTMAASDPTDANQGRGDLSDQKSALVADVASGFGNVLEEGVGYPTDILVVSPEAPYHLLAGGVYTYYEFTVPAEQRMTDETWRSTLASGSAPAMPDWTSSFIVP